MSDSTTDRTVSRIEYDALEDAVITHSLGRLSSQHGINLDRIGITCLSSSVLAQSLCDQPVSPTWKPACHWQPVPSLRQLQTLMCFEFKQPTNTQVEAYWAVDCELHQTTIYLRNRRWAALHSYECHWLAVRKLLTWIYLCHPGCGISDGQFTCVSSMASTADSCLTNWAYSVHRAGHAISLFRWLLIPSQSTILSAANQMSKDATDFVDDWRCYKIVKIRKCKSDVLLEFGANLHKMSSKIAS